MRRGRRRVEGARLHITWNFRGHSEGDLSRVFRTALRRGHPGWVGCSEGTQGGYSRSVTPGIAARRRAALDLAGATPLPAPRRSQSAAGAQSGCQLRAKLPHRRAHAQAVPRPPSGVAVIASRMRGSSCALASAAACSEGEGRGAPRVAQRHPEINRRSLGGFAAHLQRADGEREPPVAQVRRQKGDADGQVHERVRTWEASRHRCHQQSR